MNCHQDLDIGGKPLGTWKLEVNIENDTWNSTHGYSTFNLGIHKLQLSLSHENYLEL